MRGYPGIVVAFVLLPMCLAAAGGQAPRAGLAAAAIDVAVASRAMQPGELVVFTMRVVGQTSPVHGEPPALDVDLFGRRAEAFPLGDGAWRALVGIDLDQKPGPYVATVEARLPLGTTHITRPIVVKPKVFPTRTLSVSPDFVNPPVSERQRIERDSAFLRAIFAASASKRLWTQPFTRPVPDPANSRFGTRSIFNGERRSPHAGADFASPLGRPVEAPAGGRVVAARELFFPGNVVIIDHGLGMFSMLAHLSRIDVKEGDDVKAGEIVGLVGATGRVTGPHLHWSLTVSGARVDPVSALALLGDVR
jgi:murein DD-endopeptidase MepM/ murein hydrolase activator NlpD